MSYSNGLVVNACGCVRVTGGAIHADTWLNGATVAFVDAGRSTITLDRACDELDSIITLTPKHNAFAVLTAQHTSDTVIEVHAWTDAGAHTLADVSYSFLMERKPGT